MWLHRQRAEAHNGTEAMTYNAGDVIVWRDDNGESVESLVLATFDYGYGGYPHFVVVDPWSRKPRIITEMDLITLS